MQPKNYITLNGKPVEIGDERNLLELIRKANIELPTFCYHSELSVYGACRLCIVDIEGMGIVTSCSTIPAARMVIRTHTEELRKMRRFISNCCWPIIIGAAQHALRAACANFRN